SLTGRFGYESADCAKAASDSTVAVAASTIRSAVRERLKAQWRRTEANRSMFSLATLWLPFIIRRRSRIAPIPLARPKHADPAPISLARQRLCAISQTGTIGRVATVGKTTDRGRT